MFPRIVFVFMVSLVEFFLGAHDASAIFYLPSLDTVHFKSATCDVQIVNLNLTPSHKSSCISYSIHEAPKYRTSICIQPFANGLRLSDDGYLIH